MRMLPEFRCSQRWVRQDGQEQSALKRPGPALLRVSIFWVAGCETKAWAHRTEKYCRFALLTSASQRAPPSIPAPFLPPEQTVSGCPAGVPGFLRRWQLCDHVWWGRQGMVGLPTPCTWSCLPQTSPNLPVWAHGAWAADDLDASEVMENETTL